MEGNNKKKKNYYRYHHNQSNKNYYYKPKKKLIVGDKDLEENILLYSNQELIETEPQKKIVQVIQENIPDYEEVDLTPKKKSKKHFSLTKIFGKRNFKFGLGFAVLVFALIGVTYSYFTYHVEDSRQADISSGEVYVKLVEQTVNLNLNKIYPRSSEEARERADNYIDFTIKGKNTSSSKAMYYKINIINGDDVANKTRIDPQYIKVDLQEKINNSYVYIQDDVGLVDYSFISDVPINTSSEITREFRIRIWINDEIIISDTEEDATYTQSEYENLYANFKIRINSYDGTPPAAETIKNVQGLENVADAYRYVGSDPNNYVVFNSEQWRIIGVYGNRLKIVNLTATSAEHFNNTSSNVWDESTLKTLLNSTYYNNLSNDDKEMIDEGIWNVGAASADATATSAYTSSLTTTWTGKVGLISSYEYLFGAGNDCRETSGSTGVFTVSCNANDWLKPASDSWTITPSTESSKALVVYTNGSVGSYGIENTKVAYPVVYLKPEVIITGGRGTIDNEYTLGYLTQ